MFSPSFIVELRTPKDRITQDQALFMLLALSKKNIKERTSLLMASIKSRRQDL